MFLFFIQQKPFQFCKKMCCFAQQGLLQPNAKLYGFYPR